MEKNKLPERPRRFFITINNPKEHGFTHDKLRNILNKMPSVIYWCMADEVGNETETYHTHIYISLKNGMRFSTLQNKFEKKANIKYADKSSAECRDYIFKGGSWEKSEKAKTRVEGTQEEYGKAPKDDGNQKRAKNEQFYGKLHQLIMDGYTDGEIIAYNPNYIPLISKFPIIRNAVRTKEYAYTRRTVEVFYITGINRRNKIKEIRDIYGDENVFSIVDYSKPQLFEDYDCQDVLILEEFESSLPFNTLLHYLQDYPTKLSARYSNKVACYTKVYIMSELSIQRQYPSHQYDENKCFKEFIDKIKAVVICEDGKELTIFPNADKGKEHTEAPKD